MTEEKKALPRRSLKTQFSVKIFAIGVAAILLSVGITLLLVSLFVSASAKKHTKRGYELLVGMLSHEREYYLDEDFDFESLIENGDASDPQFQDALTHIKQAMQSVGKAFGMDYIYLYDIDETGHSIIYYVAATGDEQDPQKKETVAKLQYGTVVSMDRWPKMLERMRQARTGKEDAKVSLYSNEFGTELAWNYPIRNRDGKVIMLLGTEYDASGLVWSITFILLLTTGFIVALTAALLFLIRRMMEERLLQPIIAISDAMDQFVHDYSTGEGAGKKGYLRSEVIRQDDEQDEMDDIVDSFLKMSGDIDRYIHDLDDLHRQQMEYAVQMELTKHVQDGIVPETVRYESDRFALIATAEPAKMFGGDFYDWFLLDETRVAFLIGDVSGKGITAAMFMVMVKSSLSQKLRLGVPPAEALNTLNDEICECNPEGLFATIFAGILDTANGGIVFANAGHERPVVFCEKPYFQEMDSGIAIGLFEDAGIIEEHMTLAPGQGVLLYTDGVTEAVSPDDELFGEDRLLAYAPGIFDIDAAAASLKDQVNAFYGGRERFDDLTFLAMFYKGA